jgi:hypothetical protein
MGVQSFIKSALKSSLGVMDAEPVTIGDATALAVIDMTDSAMTLDIGGDDNRRSLRAIFAADAFATLPKSGQRATCRGKTWKIIEVDSGQAVLSITLEEPDRRK